MSDDLLSIFWVEVGEHLETLNRVMLQVEMLSTEDEDQFTAQVREMNRVAHSMKGAARAVGVTPIETVSHYMEEIFGAALNRRLEITPDTADTIYDGLDVIQNVAHGDSLPESVFNALLGRMEGLLATISDPKSNSQQVKAVSTDEVPSTATNGNGNAPPTAATTDEPAENPPTTDPPETQTLPAIHPTTEAPTFDSSTMLVRPAEETVRVTVGKLDKLMAEVTELFVARMHSEELQRNITDLRQMHTRWQREWRSVRAAYIRLVRRLQDQGEDVDSELPTIFRFLESNQRHLLEANRRLGAISQTATQDSLRLTTLADQLQDDIGGMRLMPFETITGMFQRMVRDLARDMGKQIMLEINGASVEIDKTVLDALKDPLMHVLRNNVDHGIEPPTTRQAVDKPPTGRIRMDVQQRGSEIVVEVQDDGQGIDADRMRHSIVKNGLMSETEAAKLSDDEVRTYIFYSGLSTSDEVTSLSGRGLGMDIVRDRVESLRGRVGVHSTPGYGTTITLSVPVSLTRIRCVLLRIGEHTFAVPSAMVVRMDKIDRDAVFTAEGRDMLEVNDRPMLVTTMGTILDVPTQQADAEQMSYIALEATDRAVAFEVDQLFSETELVLKPLGPELTRARYVSGAALLGSGDVIIILDANDLVRRASGAALPRRATAVPVTPVERRLRVLVVDDSITTRTLEKNILETAGFEVYVAMDGQEAWNMLPQHNFDVIISDVEMPNMNGLQLTARIKSNADYQHIPVVLLTSLGKPEQREAGLRAGANAYLVKSRFDQGELLQTIQAVVMR